ncbi:MAG: hypothetical protein ACREGE_03555 [Candidatus Microsaccharimonas sp.]
MLFSEEILALLLVIFIFAVPAGASTRFDPRSLFMHSVTPGATTSYELSLNYMTPESVGSLDMLFCVSPIPHDPCVAPEGLNVSGATLASQTGETGFAISQTTSNHIVLSRAPAMISNDEEKSVYLLENIVNPTDESEAFSIRLRSHSSTDATGPQIDFGSVRGQVGEGILIQTQVPPHLTFCVAQQVTEDCTETNETYFTDMGSLDEGDTLMARSQMAVGTNASAGFAITVNGTSLTAGTNVIDPSETPTPNSPGQNQFGINLVENDELNLGSNPEGAWTNAQPSPEYSIPNQYLFNSGDVIATSPSVSLMRKFTVSYVVNANPDLRAGLYTTTINYIASGRF